MAPGAGFVQSHNGAWDCQTPGNVTPDDACFSRLNAGDARIPVESPTVIIAIKRGPIRKKSVKAGQSLSAGVLSSLPLDAFW